MNNTLLAASEITGIAYDRFGRVMAIKGRTTPRELFEAKRLNEWR